MDILAAAAVASYFPEENLNNINYLQNETSSRRKRESISRVPHSAITLEVLTSHFHLPITDVAKELGVCATVLKKICRHHGIPRWPHRKIKSIDKMINSLEASLGKTSTNDTKIEEELKDLKKYRNYLILHPAEISSKTKNCRTDICRTSRRASSKVIFYNDGESDESISEEESSPSKSETITLGSQKFLNTQSTDACDSSSSVPFKNAIPFNISAIQNSMRTNFPYPMLIQKPITNQFCSADQQNISSDTNWSNPQLFSFASGPLQLNKQYFFPWCHPMFAVHYPGLYSRDMNANCAKTSVFSPIEVFTQDSNSNVVGAITVSNATGSDVGSAVSSGGDSASNEISELKDEQ